MENCLHACADVALFVASGNANGDERRVGRGRRWFNDDIEMILIVKPVNDNEAADKERGGKEKIDHELANVNFGTALSLFDLNARGESILEFIEMRDDEYLCKIIFYEIDGFDKTLASLCIL